MVVGDGGGGAATGGERADGLNDDGAQCCADSFGDGRVQIGAVVYDFSCFRETVSPGIQGACVDQAAGCFVGAGLETLALCLLFGGEENAFEEAEVPAEFWATNSSEASIHA